ncbi:pal1 cell morphology protein [Fusarium austroafricanum]|uniref:Pal1 cell morphology protein n=1 Tax=Fusarium austroafricanum TaxID=2364996 RepID=A0A8H4KX94_9HYPO|nr:pal1 cell morphology protein [Fusarium austroafricanum]
MSTAQSFQSVFLEAGHAGSGQSPGLTLNLSSNNPFRNRAPSPASADLLFPSKPASPFDDPPARPLSRNPFLDQPVDLLSQPLRSPGAMSSHSDSKSLSAEEIFNSMTLDDSPNDQAKQQPRRPNNGPPPRRGDNPPPPQNGNHRPTRSQEEALRARKMQGSGPRPQQSSPQRRAPPRRPRRNSESSLVDFDARPITEEEKRMIEAARRREYERQRRGEGKERGDRSDRDRDRRERGDGEKTSRPSRPSRKMDIIDQLDATSIYGTGLFHHDGPFDALNPHRNRQNARRAPMQAFPKDSLNNSLGGAGPLNARADHSVLMGNATEEAFRDFSAPSKARSKEPAIFDASGRDKIVHGDESVGLGTSTFLEGTPAARSAIQRHQAEQAQEITEGGLQRKKSLAQRIRHINKGPRDYNQSGRSNGEYSRITPDAYPTAASTGSDNNPFFAEFGKGDEGFSARPRDGSMASNSPGGRRPSAGAVLERRATTDAATTLDDAPAKPSGLMGRMKSLKGRKPRPEIPSNGPGVPGTAV